MDLGAFSVSLAVADLDASRDFYGRLGFTTFGGDGTDWLILKNGDHVIGLFQGMFDKNILTFNPGWDANAQPLGAFTDIRDLQRALKEQGVAFAQEADEDSSGPASFVVVDPDGNPILVDQHVLGQARRACASSPKSSTSVAMSAGVWASDTSHCSSSPGGVRMPRLTPHSQLSSAAPKSVRL